MSEQASDAPAQQTPTWATLRQVIIAARVADPDGMGELWHELLGLTPGALRVEP